MGDTVAQLNELRHCFERAKKRLEALPECGLSEAGQPYVEEAADALQSFAAWFGGLTFDRCSLGGSARRVHVAVNAFDAIVDWVGLHRSQQFAEDIAQQMAELVEQSEALDDAVMAAFLVEKTPSKVVYTTSAFVSQEKQAAIEDGIEAVASLAGHLGIRLRRIALMTGSQPAKAIGKPGGKSPGRSRKGGGGRPLLFPRKFYCDAVAARERHAKEDRKAKRRVRSVPQSVSDFFLEQELPLSRLPPKEPEKPEPWGVRANRFWKTAKAQVKRNGK